MLKFQCNGHFFRLYLKKNSVYYFYLLGSLPHKDFFDNLLITSVYCYFFLFFLHFLTCSIVFRFSGSF
jgi:hypothetical protein